MMQPHVVIVGAGISGLMAARHLSKAGLHVTVLDKGNRPGGRMATRLFEGGVFDYGAQFFTVRHERFAAFQREWEEKGLLRVWGQGFNGVDDGHPRYIGKTGMNSIPGYLAQGVHVQYGVNVSRIFPSGRHWTIETDIDEVLLADALIVTCPAPQALLLMTEALNSEERLALERIQYERCLALMAVLEHPVDLPEPGARQIEGGEPISWIADNRRKGISAFSNCITIHAGAQFSSENWEKSADEVARKLLNDLHASAWKLHRWKNSKPVVLHPEPFLMLNIEQPAIFAGDGFGEGRVEGAALSGLTAAERLRERLS